MIFSSRDLALLRVADEVVVDDERRMEARAAHVVQFGHQLIRFLDAGPPAVDDNDVAELTLEGAAARILQSPARVAIDLQQIVARARHGRHVRRLRLFVAPLEGLAAGEVIEELGPGGFGLADEDHVAQAGEELLLYAYQGAAHDREDVQPRSRRRISRIRAFCTFIPVTPTRSYARRESQSISSTFSSSR